MARLFSPRFAVHVAIVLLILGGVQLAASLVFYQVIDRQTLKDDHARRVAELLVVSDRTYALAPERTAASMSTRHLSANVATAPLVRQPPGEPGLADIGARILEWEPSLADRSLRLGTEKAAGGRRDLVGSILLADGNWLNFRSQDITSMWPVALRATVLTLATTIACLGIGLVVLYLLARPLRHLTDAAEAIGHGRDEVIIREHGARDLRDLAHAMNVMQERIARLLKDQAKAFEAISHDLRTPLSRQKVVADLIDDPELAPILHGSVAEMDDLLSSLQRFLRAQHLAAEAEPIALVPFLGGIIEPFGDRAILAAHGHPTVHSFREPLALAVSALVENAVQFGEQASVTLEPAGNGWAIIVEDKGPGIPPDYFEAILDPFFRLDEARQRDTRGFGLGIPTAHRLMMRFSGGLTFSRAAGGGLSARVVVPEG